MKISCAVLAFVFLVCAVARAEVRVFVKGDSLRIDTSGFPPKMVQAHNLMMQKCNKCHSIERVIISAQTGICAISRTSFSKETTRAIVTRMYLKPGADMTKSEARSIVLFLNYLLDQKVVVVERKD
ncbi:MAG TPA: hypothetical protein VI298_08220 [Geobacteraceae bacterium]